MVNPDLLVSLGATAAVFLSGYGAAFGSIPACTLVQKCKRGDAGEIFKSVAPLAICGVLAIYGVIVALILTSYGNRSGALSSEDGYRYLGAGFSVGLACWVSGLVMGAVLSDFIYDSDNFRVQEPPSPPSSKGTHAMRPSDGILKPLLPALYPAHHPNSERLQYQNEISVPWSLLISMVFLEAIGLYGFIVALSLV
jgi:ATP synthase proteolipid subunit